MFRWLRCRQPKWRYVCDTPDFTFTADNPPSIPPLQRIDLPPYRGMLREACDWLEGHQCFKVISTDVPAHEIHYKINWTAYRELVPCIWAAILATPETAGSFHTASLIRSEAIKFVLGQGNHSLKYVDDEFAIIWYYKKD